MSLPQSYGMPHGLGMGGDLEKFRLFVPDTLEGCVARNNCLTFETGSFFNDYRKQKSDCSGVGGVAGTTLDSGDSHEGPEFDIGEVTWREGALCQEGGCCLAHLDY